MKLRIVFLVFSVTLSLVLGLEETSTANQTQGQSSHKDKFIFEYFRPRNKLTLDRKVFILNSDLYTPWTEWGNCSRKDCRELRYRRCINDSHKEWIRNIFHTKNCPFEYFVESRRCVDDSQCKKKGESLCLLFIT